jgi:hypothetical protein
MLGRLNIEEEIIFSSVLGQHNSYFIEPQIDLQDFIKRFIVSKYKNLHLIKSNSLSYAEAYTWCNPKVPEIWIPRENRL